MEEAGASELMKGGGRSGDIDGDGNGGMDSEVSDTVDGEIGSVGAVGGNGEAHTERETLTGSE